MVLLGRVRTLGVLGVISCIVVVALFGAPIFRRRHRDLPPDRARQTGSIEPQPLLLHPLPGYVLDPEFGTQLLRAGAHACELKNDPTYHIHALRLVAIARSELPGEPSEAFFEDCLSVMLDHRRFERTMPELPILRTTAHGARYRTHAQPRHQGITASMPGGMTHVDKPLSVFGELGLPLSTPIHTADGDDLTIGDLLEDSLQRYHSEREVEWTFLAYCDYLGGQDRWTNRRGEHHRMADLLTRLQRQHPLEGPCLGGHRLYALAKALATRHHAARPFTDAEYASIRQSLQSISTKLAATQRRDGAWSRHWSGDSGEDDNASPDDRWDLDGLTATSHMLEWFAIAEESCRPPDDVIRRAVRYMEARLRRDTNYCFNQALAPTTHAIRALFHLSEGRPRPED